VHIVESTRKTPQLPTEATPPLSAAPPAKPDSLLEEKGRAVKEHEDGPRQACCPLPKPPQQTHGLRVLFLNAHKRLVRKAEKREDRKPDSLLEEKERAVKEPEDGPRQACCPLPKPPQQTHRLRVLFLNG